FLRQAARSRAGWSGLAAGVGLAIRRLRGPPVSPRSKAYARSSLWSRATVGRALTAPLKRTGTEGFIPLVFCRRLSVTCEFEPRGRSDARQPIAAMGVAER